MSGTPPVIPDDLKLYDSYATDPKYARGFIWTYTAALAAAALVSLPALVHSVRNRRALQGLGFGEDLTGRYEQLQLAEKPRSPPPRRAKSAWSILDFVRSKGALQVPVSWVNLDLSQSKSFNRAVSTMFSDMVCIAALGVLLYFAGLIFCILHKVDLLRYPDRAGFMSVAQLPIVFLFANKNGLLPTLLGMGYEKLNWLHRWTGRGILFTVTVHGALWIRQYTVNGLPEQLKEEKEVRGLVAYSLLCLLVLLSLPPVRRFFYQAFFAMHVLLYTAFFVMVCYHTPYASPYIFPAIAFYAFDMFVRMLRFRIQDATVVALDQNMTLIYVHNLDHGWTAGQHVRVRSFHGGRMFESHPLTIINAAPTVSCSTSTRGLLLGARVQGPWTRALNALASQQEQGIPLAVMLDGPYGGCSIDLGRFENVLLVAGGSGVTFTLGLLDDLVGRISRQKRRHGEHTRKIEFVWCVRSFGVINWFADFMGDIAEKAQQGGVELHFGVFVTCLCNPEALPDIPGLNVTLEKPRMKAHLATFLSAKDNEASQPGGGLGVAVCGPRELTTEAQNTIAMLSLTQTRRLGGVELHTEHFCL